MLDLILILLVPDLYHPCWIGLCGRPQTTFLAEADVICGKTWQGCGGVRACAPAAPSSKIDFMLVNVD
jgi:hypothetical protein